MRRLAVATIAGAGLALAVTSTRPAPVRVFLPIAPVRVYPTRTPSATWSG